MKVRKLTGTVVGFALVAAAVCRGTSAFGVVGSGPDFGDPSDIAVEASGDLVVVDRDLDAVVRVDPVTGDRTIVSDAGTGAGPAFVSPGSIAVEASGDLVVTDPALRAVVRVDPVTGDRTIVSDAGTGAGQLQPSRVLLVLTSPGRSFLGGLAYTPSLLIALVLD